MLVLYLQYSFQFYNFITNLTHISLVLFAVIPYFTASFQNISFFCFNFIQSGDGFLFSPLYPFPQPFVFYFHQISYN